MVAGYGIAVPVGAVGAYLVALTARARVLVGACAALGVATADLVYAAAAVAGGGAAAAVLEPVAGPMELVFAGVLLAVSASIAARSVRAYRAPGPTPAGPPAMTPARAFGALLGLTLLNPTTVVYFTALVAGGAATALDDTMERTVFVTAAFVASASWQLVLVGGGAVLGQVLTAPRGRLTASALASSAVAGQALLLLLR
nr:LysE family transporter [Motilibacter aurantiacus]